jgi:hypothetical protein
MKFSKELDLRFFQYLALARFKLSWRTYKPSLLFDLRDAPLAEGIGGLTLFTAASLNLISFLLEPTSRGQESTFTSTIRKRRTLNS